MSGPAFLKALADLGQRVNAECQGLFRRLGVKPSEGRVVVIVICEDEWRAHEALFDLFAECETIFRRTIDQHCIRYVSCKTLESAKANPNLELASFILVVDEDLLEAKYYPELEKILPFQR